MFGKGRANVPCSAQLEGKITPPKANHETRLLYVSDELQVIYRNLATFSFRLTFVISQKW